MPSVAVWRHEVLPSSETFIINQARAMRRWRPILAGLRAVPNTMGITPDFALEGSRALTHRADRWLYSRTGTSPRLLRQLRRTSLVHAHFGPDGIGVRRAARLAGRPLIVTFHGYDATIPARELGVEYTGLFDQAAKLLAVSDFIRECLVAAGAPTEKLVVRHIGIPVPPDHPRGENGDALLFVGRLVAKKGCADLLTALAGLDRPPPLLVIGDGPLRSQLEEMAKSLRVQARFVGAQNPGYIAEAMRASTVLCVPSQAGPNGDREGLGIVFLEAASHRLPVVSYASGGVPESVVDGQTGLLATEGDVPGLGRHLQRVLSDREFGDRLGAAGRRRVEAHFDIRHTTSQLERLYDEVAGAASRRLSPATAAVARFR